MIAKEIAARRTGGSFRNLVSYLTSSRGMPERVRSVRLTNCVSADVESAVLEVENTQARNLRARHTTYHLMLAFPAGEQPSAEVLQEVERRACDALGFAEHERLSVVHHDTDHLHMHVAINRVHRRSAKVHSPSFSKLVLDRICVELEAEYGLQPVHHRARDRGAALIATDTTALRTRRPPDMERVSGLESLMGFVQRECAESFRTARSWSEVHDVAAVHGLRLRLRGNGLVFVGSDGNAVKASSVSRDLSKTALERRLGPFEGTPTAAVIARTQFRKRPLSREASPRLYEQYLRDREIAVASRRAVGQLREQSSHDDERLRAASQRRWEAIRFVAKGRLAWMLWSAYARQVDRRERARARQRYGAGLRAAAGKHRPMGWVAWLRDRAARGDADALAALRTRSAPREGVTVNAVCGDEPARAMPLPPDGVTTAGTVIYRVPGGSIRDDGKRMHLTQLATSDAAAEALLRLALARYGSRIGVDGDDTFRTRLERVAAAASLPITFAETRSPRLSAELQPKEGAGAARRRARSR